MSNSRLIFIFCSDCEIKQWLPPETNTNFRRCRYDTHESVISNCPEQYKDWKIAKLCEREPTSFVYEGGDLSQILVASDLLIEQLDLSAVGDDLVEYSPGRKFKNSYCASCNAAGWLGCRAKKSFMKTTFMYDNSVSNYIRYYSHSVQPYMFVFSIDLNRRTCTFDSDGFMVLSNSTTGLDTCRTIGETLQSCACFSVFDFATQSCVEVPHLEHASCLTNNSGDAASADFSSYAKQVCKISDLKTNMPLCVGQHINSSGILTFYDMISDQPVDPCHIYGPIGCRIPNNGSVCISKYPWIRAKDSGVIQHGFNAPKFTLQNSVAISYSTLDYDFNLAQKHIHVKAGLDILFDLTLIASKGSCAGFSVINDTLSSLLVCPNHSLVHTTTAEVFSEYLLQHNEIKVCTEYSEIVFRFNIYHYVLCGLSALCLLTYIVWYFIWSKQKTLTGNFFICQLATLIVALLCYCFIVSAKEHTILCKIVTSLVQYSFLSVHCWTNVLAVWMFRGLSKSKLVKRDGQKAFAAYAIYGWLAPLPFVVFGFILNAFQVDGLYPVFSDSFCFLASGWIRVLLFTGPIYLQIFVDVGLCIGVAVIIWRSGNGLASNRSNHRQVKMKVFSLIKLIIIFGIQWVLLFFTEIESPYVTHLWTALNVLVALQGVLIILAQLLTRSNIVRLSKFMRTPCNTIQGADHVNSVFTSSERNTSTTDV